MATMEVASAPSCDLSANTTSAGTNRTPPPTPTRPPAIPAASPRAIRPLQSRASISEDEHGGRGDQQGDEGRGHGALGQALLQRGPGHDADRAGDADPEPQPEVDVAVDRLCGRGDRADQDDGGQRRAGRLLLLEAEPEHEQRDHDGAAADPEQPAEGPRARGDARQAQHPSRHRGAYYGR